VVAPRTLDLTPEDTRMQFFQSSMFEHFRK
jgi:hypothetical protein